MGSVYGPRCARAALLALLGLAACATDGGRRTAVPPAPVHRDAKAAAPAIPRVDEGAVASLGDTAPDFTLTDLDGAEHRLSAYRGRIVVLEWFNPTCPYTLWAHTEGPLVEQPRRYASQGVVWLAVNSEGPGNPGAAPERNRKFVAEHGLSLPLLLDPTGAVGQAYRVKTTPTFCILNERGVMVYRGGLDNAPLGLTEGNAAKMNYVDAAIADLRSGHAVMASGGRAYGCPVRYARR